MQDCYKGIIYEGFFFPLMTIVSSSHMKMNTWA